jgi:membrane associated rhomboid family serine protease
VSTGGPDLFVVCKSCGSEVSPYITECPYCGSRLRKRAPKIDRHGRVTEKKRRRNPTPALPRLRRGEIPGIRADSHPYATGALVIASIVGCLIWRTSLLDLTDLAVIGKPGGHAWRLVTAPFTYDNTGYAFITISVIALFGWLLERRHGMLAPLLLFAVGGIGGTAATAAFYDFPVVLGANGAALAMICAWSVPDLLRLRAGEEVESDLIGALVLAGAVAVMPLAVVDSSWISDLVGIIGGFAIGYPLALLRPQ